ATSRSFSSRDQRRRRSTDVMTSIGCFVIWLLLVLALGLAVSCPSSQDGLHRGLTVEPTCRILPIAPSTYYESVAKRLDVDRLSIRTRRARSILAPTQSRLRLSRAQSPILRMAMR